MSQRWIQSLLDMRGGSRPQKCRAKRRKGSSRDRRCCCWGQRRHSDSCGCRWWWLAAGAWYTNRTSGLDGGYFRDHRTITVERSFRLVWFGVCMRHAMRKKSSIQLHFLAGWNKNAQEYNRVWRILGHTFWPLGFHLTPYLWGEFLRHSRYLASGTFAPN